MHTCRIFLRTCVSNFLVSLFCSFATMMISQVSSRGMFVKSEQISKLARVSFSGFSVLSSVAKSWKLRGHFFVIGARMGTKNCARP